MRNELTFLVEDAPEGSFTARALGESIFTDADTWRELEANAREAAECHFDEGGAPRVIRLRHEGNEKTC